MPKFSLTLMWTALAAAVCSTAALAQRPLHGTVTDGQSGAPIIAARVLVKGTTIGTYTTADGGFTLNVPEGPITLDVRRIGYLPLTMPVAADQNDVGIKLKADVLQLTTEIITGQATTIARQNSANNIAVLSSQDLTHTHEQTIDNALQGKVAGADITANSGAPGGGLQVRIRGITSIFGNAQPLYVVDGVPVSNTTVENGLNAISLSAGGGMASNQDNGVNRIADLNPDDIADIEILKGPSAAAIYGSSAANGVVLITTKRGTEGKPRFSFTQRLGTNTDAHKIGAFHFTPAEAVAFGANFGVDSASVMQNYNECHGYCDFEQEVYGDHSLSYESNLSLSGGTAATQYYVSGLASHDNGTMYGTGYTKQSLRGNLSQLIGSKLSLQVNTNFVHSLTRRGLSNNDNINATPYFVFGETPSFWNLEPTNGVYPYNPFPGNGSNPLQTIALLQTPEELFRFIGSVNATYTPINTETQNLKATLNLGIDNYTYKANLYAPPTLYWQASQPLPGVSTDLSAIETQAPMALTLAHRYETPSNSFQATTSIGARTGYDYITNTNDVTSNTLGDQTNVGLGTQTLVFMNRTQVNTLAWFGQEEVLLFDQRLYLTAGILGQRSTNNAHVNQFYYYPKAAASYRWPTLGPFQEFKLRFAYGETGNEPLYGNKFGLLAPGVYGGFNSTVLGGTVADPNLHPEREREFEGGFDAGLFNSRISLSATVYQKDNTQLLLQAQPAASMGFARDIFNGGSIRNRGVEASISGYPIQMSGFSWNTRLTYARNKGVVTSLPVPAFSAPSSFGFAYGAGFIQVDQSPSQIHGYANGVLTAVGDYLPTFTMGFSNDFAVGPVHLYGLLDWRRGGDVVNITQNVYDEVGTAPDSAGMIARLAGFSGRNPITGAKVPRQSVYIQDASFLKLREVTLSYQLSDRLVQSAFNGRVTSARLELTGRNLATWTPYKGLDPEVSNFGIQNINTGQDLAPYPPVRSYFFTLAVDF